MSDIFEFWQRYRPPQWFHPADEEVLRRVDNHFDKKSMPAPFSGPLKSAPVVLLYLAPGLSKGDHLAVRSVEGRRRKIRRLFGTEPLSSQEEHCEAWNWWHRRTKVFGPWEEIRSKIAIFEICPYHSKAFHDWAPLSALPSCRLSVEWAQDVLFTQAEKCRRIVICLRAHKHWGLTAGHKYNGYLFAPEPTRGGYMIKSRMRTRVIETVKEFLV